VQYNVTEKFAFEGEQ